VKRVRLATPGVISAAVAAAALILGTSPAGAATTPSAGWHSFTPPVAGGSLLDLYAPSAGDAWAVGESSTGGSLYQHFANGTAWKSAKGPSLGPVSAISGTSDKDLWVLGASSSANYNGSSWTTHPLVIPAGTAGEGDQFDTSADALYVAGPTDVYAAVAVIDNTSLANEDVLEHFNGTAWSVVTNVPNVSTANSLISQITGSGPDDVYLSVVNNNGTEAELEHFNGTSWSSVSLPGTPFDVNVEETGSGQALAVGSSDGAGYAAQLSGGKWTKVSMPFTDALPVGEAGGSGRAWAAMVNYDNGSVPESLWQWSAGKWTQIQPNHDGASDGLVGATDGSGLWALTFGNIFTGDGGTSTTELFVG
jgi:hypothetical protein